ncbi:CBS domain-containing protein [Melghirimyces algeriensis]|uniref:CBS domain-containing protein n=1 Tax=Melghirimyces algeriensis TaxID=910412 RepID=A0A521BSE3_9BACL|nr:CBS domain-containing protein [Melghirimyces algeriensis]SMO49661.1 CBS domain-containing protein [Melghirimyces algeriensis]
MFIKNCLTPTEEIITVTPETAVKELIHTLEANNLESIPVVNEKGYFLGITGYNYVMKASIKQGKEIKDLTVKDTLHLISPLTINNDFEETLPLIVRYPFVPVVHEDGFTFLGIVKISDIESALADTYGHELPGIRFLLAVVLDAPHELESIVDTVRDLDVNIISVVTFDAGNAAARRILLKVSPTPHIEIIRNRLEEKGFRVLSLKEKK